MTNISIILNENDVINTNSNVLINHQTFTSKEFLEKIRGPLSIHRPSDESYGWVGEGVECEVLSCQGNTQGWQSGRVRIILEFIAEETIETTKQIDDESSSPLDDIRQSIEQGLS